ncbi:nitroreductase family protein [Methanovulcanius yangii]|uniref:nitroreductase family protein n=1 Tax=Methanovulcanius yangii TaxID=1789227 RepID=UPI0029C9B3F8|nr:nitroreductase family protein [Methanovulcanius yangii]
MSVIAVSRDDCTKCGVCVNVCPAFIISMEKGDYPLVTEDKEKRCMRCGHCEVFCPFDALKVDFKGDYPANFNPRALDIKPDQFGKFMQSRRSIRQFRKKPVDPRVLDDVMETVRFAPTAANRQKVHYIVIMDTEKVRRISALAIEWMQKVMSEQPDHPYADIFNGMIEAYDQGIDLVCRNAPHIIFAAVPTNNPFAVTDAAIALTWFELVAKAYGVGSCWLGTLKLAAEEYLPIQEELHIPKGYLPNYALIFGLPKLRSKGVPKRDPLSVEYI